MEKYQIVEIREAENHAGTKAHADIAAVADRLGFRRLNVKVDTGVASIYGKARRQYGYFRDWSRAKRKIQDGSVLLLQNPFHDVHLTREKTLRYLKEVKNIRIISLIHDVEELRKYRYNDFYAHEFCVMLDLADILIVHNEEMKKWFVSKGVPESRLVVLEIFDYLQDEGKNGASAFERSITVAGNLDTSKCGYIGQLGGLSGVRVHLYGPNFDEKLSGSENVEYHGSYPVNEIPDKLDRGFGLVWDGDSIDGCLGESGQYLRYNNPHKLSLYLSSGLPVVIWKEAAEAGFVRDNGVGILVDSVRELETVLNDIDEAAYIRMRQNALKVAAGLRSGFYAEKALEKALSLLDTK